MNKRSYKIISILALLLIIGLCGAGVLTALGSGITLWFALNKTEELQSISRPRSLVSLVTLTPSPTTSPTFLATATMSPTPLPTASSTPTSLPTATPTHTPTLIPPTATPSATLPPPTVPPLPTNTPTPLPPDFPFTIEEVEKFDTNHHNFDVYVAITDANNKPLSGYHLVGYHSNGLQIESQVSANNWTENSGAMHYKAGNIKYAVPNSSDGTWTLQLMNEAGEPVSPPVDFPFDTSNPSWYFILYRLTQE